MKEKIHKLTKLKFNDVKDMNKLLGYAFLSFIIILLLQVIGYFAFLNNIPDFLSKYGWWLFYLNISIVSIVGAIWYYESYGGYVSCMASMMIGMTLGMQTGMMIGSVFGAVNGYFIGAMIGMILGTVIGLITGTDSVMGMVQGMMSGVMGGTMGAMITVMMFTDHVLLFMPFYMLINLAILLGFIYMYHDEVIKENKDVIKKDLSISWFILICVMIAVILSAILIYAPKSILFGG
ncbi:MAG: hypothetical protein ACP5OA_00795 [Candidatus Woesearchaeota archaeon]